MNYDLKVINEVKDILVGMKKTMAVAESVTSGHLQAALSAATEASLFFQGGITAYNLGQKTRHLDIEPISADPENCVSETVACEMALGVNKLFLSHYSLSATGYAKTVPEQGINDIYAFYAIAKEDKILQSSKITTQKTDSVEVQIDYASQIIEIFLRLIR